MVTHTTVCRVSSAKTYCPKTRCSATCTVQRCVSCPPPALWHTPLCCPTTALVTPYCGDQKDLSQSRQIELWLYRRQLRCKVTSDRIKAPSSKSFWSEWTLSLSRTVGCFWRIGYNSWLYPNQVQTCRVISLGMSSLVFFTTSLKSSTSDGFDWITCCVQSPSHQTPILICHDGSTIPPMTILCQCSNHFTLDYQTFSRARILSSFSQC